MKTDIMTKLRAAKPPFPQAQPVTQHLPVAPLDEAADLKDQFIQNAEKLSCQVHELVNPTDLGDILGLILVGDTQISAWDWNQILCPGLEQTLQAMKIEIVPPDDPNVRVGITGADAALAATGSLVINRCPGRPNAPSLLPPLHIAIITADQILPNFEAWIAQQRLNGLDSFHRAGNIVVVSGPSRTADIAMELILGMHGPKELHVIILP
jgi:L-lactate dehydrogenase complex protein LldG